MKVRKRAGSKAVVRSYANGRARRMMYDTAHRRPQKATLYGLPFIEEQYIGVAHAQQVDECSLAAARCHMNFRVLPSSHERHEIRHLDFVQRQWRFRECSFVCVGHHVQQMHTRTYFDRIIAGPSYMVIVTRLHIEPTSNVSNRSPKLVRQGVFPGRP